MLAFLALFAVAWAAFLGLAEGVSTPLRSFGDPPPDPHAPIPLARAFLIARLSLFLLAGISGGLAVGWWRFDISSAAGGVGLSALLAYLMGEALPKTLAHLVPDAAAALVPLARATLLPFRPLIGIVAGLDRLTHRAFPRRRPPAGELGAPQREMLAGVRSLHETTVADIMTPRLDVAGVDADATWQEMIDQVRRAERSRLPVYRESLDDLMGFLHVKDLAPRVAMSPESPGGWHQLVRPLRYVPESKPLSSQLRDFQRGAAHLAIVVDEYGGTSGLVTLEDILEEVVGEIHDEYDLDDAPQVEQEGDQRYWVDGRLPLDDLAELLGSEIEHEGISTVGGLIYTELGRVPRPGEELLIADFRVVVEQVARRRIRRVYFERRGADAGADVAAPAVDGEGRR